MKYGETDTDKTGGKGSLFYIYHYQPFAEIFEWVLQMSNETTDMHVSTMLMMGLGKSMSQQLLKAKWLVL